MSQPLLMKMHVSRLENAMFGRNHAYLMTLYRCPMSIPQQQVLKKPNSLNFLLHSKAILSCSPFWWSLRRLLTLGSKKVCRSEYYITKYSCFDLFDFDTCTFGIESTYLIFGKSVKMRSWIRIQKRCITLSLIGMLQEDVSYRPLNKES